ncbi:MAG TPA: HAD-IIIA family hydrolase [Methanomassiliicoccales archaeon]|nr:HAD-IIIA family hydrolase [Methanomassiliicoccales archaeon]
MKHMVRKELESSASIIAKIDETQVMAIAGAMVASFRNGGKLIIFGNGGSAADAQHLAAELQGRYTMERPALNAIAVSNISAITAIGNDYSYDDVFQRHIEGFARQGDVVIGISTSGNSKNVLKAIVKAKEMGAVTIAFTGNKGKLSETADLVLAIPSDNTPRIQEGYMAAGHIICGLVERMLFARRAVFIDRDDTIVKDVPYCSRPEDLVLFPEVGRSIKRLNDAGFLVIIVTNQSGVSRGYFTDDMLQRIHVKLLEEIGREGGKVDAVYYCPHTPEQGCQCRKPQPGMIEQAMRDFDIDLTRSFIIGDSNHEEGLARLLDLNFFKVSDELGFARAVDQILNQME